MSAGGERTGSNTITPTRNLNGEKGGQLSDLIIAHVLWSDAYL